MKQEGEQDKEQGDGEVEDEDVDEDPERLAFRGGLPMRGGAWRGNPVQSVAS